MVRMISGLVAMQWLMYIGWELWSKMLCMSSVNEFFSHDFSMVAAIVSQVWMSCIDVADEINWIIYVV